MKLFKKLIAAAGFSGLMLGATPSHALLSLNFFDGANNLLASFNAASTSPIILGGLNINGWVVNLTTSSSDNPDVGLTIQGKLWLGNTGAVTGLSSCVNYADCSVATQRTMKIRLTDDAYPVPSNSTFTVKDVFSVSNTSTGSYGVLLASNSIQAPQVRNIPIGNLSSGQSYTQLEAFTTTSTPFDLTAGVDLIAAANSTNAANGFQFTNTISTAVPEPTTVALFGLALAGVGMMRRRKARA